MKIIKSTSLKLFQTATVAALAIITLWGVSIRSAQAQAGYTVTLQQVGPDVVATGTGVIDVFGLNGPEARLLDPSIRPLGDGVNLAFIYTGPISSSASSYFGVIGEPQAFGGSFVITPASSGSGDMVGIEVGGEIRLWAGQCSSGLYLRSCSIRHGHLQRPKSCNPRLNTGHLRMDVGTWRRPEIHA